MRRYHPARNAAPFAHAFNAFDFAPSVPALRAVASSRIAEDMRMTALQFVADGGNRCRQMQSGPPSLCHLGVEHHLVQQVPSSPRRSSEIFTGDGIQHPLASLPRHRAVVKVCSLSHGQPFSGSRRRFIMPSRRSTGQCFPLQHIGFIYLPG